MTGLFARHIGKGQKVVIDGEEFTFQPLTIDHLPQFFQMMKGFSGGKNPEDILKNLDDSTTRAVKEVIMETLRISYPDEPEEDMKKFALKYMSELMEAIMIINSSKLDKMKKKDVKSMIKQAQAKK